MNRNDRILYIGLDCMMSLLTLLLLWVAESVGALGVLLLPLLIIPASVLTCEKRIPALIINYLLSSILILFLPFPHYSWFGFVFAAGLYAPVRELLSRIRTVWIGNLIAIVAVNAGIALGIGFLSNIGISPFVNLDPFWLVLLILGIELEIILFDIVYLLFTDFYLKTIRRNILI